MCCFLQTYYLSCYQAVLYILQPTALLPTTHLFSEETVDELPTHVPPTTGPGAEMHDGQNRHLEQGTQY